MIAIKFKGPSIRLVWLPAIMPSRRPNLASRKAVNFFFSTISLPTMAHPSGKFYPSTLGMAGPKSFMEILLDLDPKIFRSNSHGPLLYSPTQVGKQIHSLVQLLVAADVNQLGSLSRESTHLQRLS